MDDKGFDSYNPEDWMVLENQICFPLYVVSKELVRSYTCHLKKLDLTYTQYIAMLVIWEEKQINVKDLSYRLYLDSGTLTPLLKKLVSKGLVTRERSDEDERSTLITVTDEGMALREKAESIHLEVAKESGLDLKEIKKLRKAIFLTIDNLRKRGSPYMNPQ